MADNKVKFGLKNVHYSLLTTSENGKVTFGTPVHIPGAVNFSMDPQGDVTQFYADDRCYYVSAANDGYSGTLEIARIPDSFRKDVLGETEDTAGKVLIENATAEGKSFALLFEFSGDQKATRHVLYNFSASRPSLAGQTTTNAKEPTTENLSLTASPLENGNVKAKTGADTPSDVYDNWYKAVWEPTEAAV